MLYQWAVSNSLSFCFQRIDKERESYFLRRTEGDGPHQHIKEYSVESLPELMKEIDKLWGADEIMSQIKKAIGVAALKNKPVLLDNLETARIDNKTVSKDKLPVFIYNF